MHSLLITVLLVAATSNLVFCQSKQLLKVDKKLERGDTIKAIAKLNKYIDRFPGDASLFYRRAELKMQRGNLDPAMVDLNAYCSLVDNCDDATYLKGLIRYKQGDYNGAISHFSNFTQHNQRASAWFYLGLSHMWLRHYDIAINAFTQSLQLDDKQVLVYYNSGLCHFYTDQFNEAVRLFEDAMELDPDDTDFIVARANALLKLKEYAEANKALRLIEETDTNFPTALYNIAVNYYHLDEIDLACDYWRRARDAGHKGADAARLRYCDKKSGKVQKW